MDEPLNPFFKGIKIAKPDSRQRHSVCNSHCKLRHSLILWPLTVIGFLIKGVLMGEISLVKPDLKPQIWCIRCFLCVCFKPSYIWKRKKIKVLGLISFPPYQFFPLFHSLSSSEVIIFFLFALSFTPPLLLWLFTLAFSHGGNLIMRWESCLPWF